MWFGIIHEPLNMMHTSFAVYIGVVYAYLPFMIMPLYTAISRVDNSLIEAAEDLGAKPFTILTKILLPLTSGGMIAGSILIYLIGPSMDLIHRTANSTATSLVWLPKSVIYASFVAGIFSILLSLCSQVPRKVYDIIHGIEDDESLLEMQALAEKTELELKKAAEAELAGEAEEIPPLAASPAPAEPIEEITETISEDEAGGEKQ